MTEIDAMPTDAETTEAEITDAKTTDDERTDVEMSDAGMIRGEQKNAEEGSPEPISEEQEVFLKHIQKKGLKRTSQRELILSVFLRTEEHLSNEDLYRLVKLEDPTVGQTTVYRTLKLLTEAGLAREVRFGDGRAHYEHNYKHQHHDHMICSECGKIIEFYSAELEAIQDAMAAKHNFEVTQHLLRIIGICDECRQQNGDISDLRLQIAD